LKKYSLKLIKIGILYAIPEKIDLQISVEFEKMGKSQQNQRFYRQVFGKSDKCGSPSAF